MKEKETMKTTIRNTIALALDTCPGNKHLQLALDSCDCESGQRHAALIPIEVDASMTLREVLQRMKDTMELDYCNRDTQDYGTERAASDANGAVWDALDELPEGDATIVVFAMKIYQVVQIYDDFGYHFDVMSLHRTREGAVAKAKSYEHLPYIENFTSSNQLAGGDKAVFVREVEVEE